jgi:hypothetical protein
MADRDMREGYGRDEDRDRWRDREREQPGWRADERRSWDDEGRRGREGGGYGRGEFRREGGTYGQGGWRGSAQRSLAHEDQRYGSHRDTGETYGQGRSYRDERGREDFGQYGQTGAGGDYGYGRHTGRGEYGSGRGGGYESSGQFGRGGYGASQGGGYGQGGYPSGEFGPGGYGAYGRSGGAVGSQLYGGYGRHGEGQTYGQSGYGEHMSSTGRDQGAEHEPYYGHGQHGQQQQPGEQYFGQERYAPPQGQRGGQDEGYGAHGQHDFEPDYLHWRNMQMQNLDRDYHRWREERRTKFAKEFDEWRRGQQGGQQSGLGAQGGLAGQTGQHSTGLSDVRQEGQMKTAGQGSSGGVSSDQDPAGGLRSNPMVTDVSDGDAGRSHGQAEGRDPRKKS